MTKKFRNKVCVYCGIRPAKSGDHVFAREFFRTQDRNSLPKVPACLECNGVKSELEHYLTAVLPFGGRHPVALKNLLEQVPKRLARNGPLQQRLRSTASPVWEKAENGLLLRTMAIPIDGAKLEALMGMIAQGLAWHHWNTLIGLGCDVRALALAPAGEKGFRDLLAARSGQKVSATVGTNVFSYEGSQAAAKPTITVWRITVYGGIVVADDAGTASSFGVLTGPKEISDRAAAKVRWLEGRGGQSE